MHTSTLITIDRVIEEGMLFNIPVYQRLYVWGSDQIKILLADLSAAKEADSKVYYLGGALVIEREAVAGGLPLFDLIDGQQRFTTLWLLGIALGRLAARRGHGEINHLADLRAVRLGDTAAPRIRFPIRPQVGEFFAALLRDESAPDVEEAQALSHAIVQIEGHFSDKPPGYLTGFSAFVRHRLQLVMTRVPPNTDLNKLFEVINNRGVQLQQHDILKSRLLHCIGDRQQREVCGLLWDACSHMHDYVEKNLRTATGIRLAPLFDQAQAFDDREMLADPRQVREAVGKIGGAQAVSDLTLASILAGPASDRPAQTPAPDDESYQADPVRSIVGFPMLLQHVLRIFLMRRGRADLSRILERDLLRIFQVHWLDQVPAAAREAEVQDFVDLLWRCRYLFDKYLIKWVRQDEEEIHAIRRLRLNKSGNSRSLTRESADADTAFAMLQSMLYHSQELTTHYWLTPLLNYLLCHGGAAAHLYLKYLDNHLLCGTDAAPLVVRTRGFLDQPWSAQRPLCDIEAILGRSDGTGFSHYWFYKLEYILWERYRDEKDEAWRAFRMTAKNSVEHVSPQTPEEFDSNRVDKALDSFGNLGLVSRSINSEYGNKPYLEKQARFRERNARRVDSLKLALIYENGGWGDIPADRHCEQMIGEYRNYFNAVSAAAEQRLRLESIA